LTENQINPKVKQYMGLSPTRKLESLPKMLSSGIITSLLTSSTSRICSHQ